jgi:hypothetical protein
MQSRAVTDFLTEHNTLKSHLDLMGQIDSPLCRKSGAEDETAVHVLCQCEALTSLRHAPFFRASEHYERKIGGYLEV